MLMSFWVPKQRDVELLSGKIRCDSLQADTPLGGWRHGRTLPELTQKDASAFSPNIGALLLRTGFWVYCLGIPHYDYIVSYTPKPILIIKAVRLRETRIVPAGEYDIHEQTTWTLKPKPYTWNPEPNSCKSSVPLGPDWNVNSECINQLFMLY